MNSPSAPLSGIRPLDFFSLLELSTISALMFGTPVAPPDHGAFLVCLFCVLPLCYTDSRPSASCGQPEELWSRQALENLNPIFPAKLFSVYPFFKQLPATRAAYWCSPSHAAPSSLPVTAVPPPTASMRCYTHRSTSSPTLRSCTIRILYIGSTWYLFGAPSRRAVSPSLFRNGDILLVRPSPPFTVDTW